ncbi:hypothetical protein ABZU75_31525 [Streptosporangium sp. NPDC005286]
MRADVLPTWGVPDGAGVPAAEAVWTVGGAGARTGRDEGCRSVRESPG